MVREVLWRMIVVVLVSGWTASAALAVQPDEILKDPKLEHRAREISEGLRCLVCQNQSIDDSDASLAKDLRLLVRERLKAGDSNQEVLDYVVARYGDFVLLKPPLKPETIALWASPLFLLLLGIWLSRRTFKVRRETVTTEVPLSAEERARLDDLLGKGQS